MPSSRILDFNDPYEYQRAIRAGNGVEVFPTTKGDFRAELVQINLDGLWMQRGRESLPRIVHAAVNADRVGIEFLSSEINRHIGTTASTYFQGTSRSMTII